MDKEELTQIAELARKKMNLEVGAKVKEMEDLKMQKDRAKEELKHLSSELYQLGRFVEQERIIVLELEKEKHSDQQKIDRLLKQVLQELKDGQNARQIVILDHHAGIKEKEAPQARS